MEDRFVERKQSFKTIDTQSLTRRREAAKKESEDSKRELLKSLRESLSEQLFAEKTSGQEIQTRRLFAKTFMYPDTLISIHENLGVDWLVGLRPEGQRCLAILVGNSLTLRQRNGQIIDTFVLDPFSVRRSDNIAMFDAIYGFNNQNLKRTLYIADVVMMKGNELVFSDFSFRQYYLGEHWPFLPSVSAPMLMDSETSVPDIVKLEYLSASSDNINRLYHEGLPTVTPDSLLFCLKDGKYVNGLTQEVLSFRDSNLSRYAIDTTQEDGFDGSESMEIVLRVVRGPKKIFLFKTWDGIVLHQSETVPEWIVSVLKRKPFVLVRCIVSNKFEFSEMKSSGKPFAMSLNRIVDQFRKRRETLKLDPIGNDMFDAPPVSISDILSLS